MSLARCEAPPPLSIWYDEPWHLPPEADKSNTPWVFRYRLGGRLRRLRLHKRLHYLSRLSPCFFGVTEAKRGSRLSTEAEYRAVANMSAELRWICSLLTELGVMLTSPPAIYCDNIAATYICQNPVFHSRMKHIAIDYHFLRGQIQNSMLRVSHISMHDQLADGLTNSLAKTPFQNICNKIVVTKVPPS